MKSEFLPSSRCETAIAGGIMLLSLALRWLHFQLNPMITRDAAVYCQIAKVWSRTGDFTIAYSEHIGGTAPLHIYFLKLGADLGIPIMTWGHILSFCFGAAFVFAFYLLGKVLFDGRGAAGLIFMFVAGIHPIIGRVSVDILREGPFFMFAAFGMVFFVRTFKKRRLGEAAVCGLLLGVSMLVRHDGLELLFLSTAALLPWGKPLREWFVWRNYRLAAAVVAGAIAAVLLTLAICGIPLKYIFGQYLSKLDKISTRQNVAP